LRQLTQVKKTEERIWLNEASDCALRQSVRQLAQAFQNFFNSRKGKRKGRQVKPPRFKKKANQQTATFTKQDFSLRPNGGVPLAKPIGIVHPIWTRPLPSEPSSVTVIKDCANRYFLSFGAIRSAERVVIPRDGWQM